MFSSFCLPTLIQETSDKHADLFTAVDSESICCYLMSAIQGICSTSRGVSIQLVSRESSQPGYRNILHCGNHKLHFRQNP